MVVAHRFRWFGWFVLCVSVILGCYLMSSRVAAERNKLAAIESSIARTQRDITALETEFDTRASFAQLQRWNGDTLKLSAPTAAQYIRSDAELAQVDFNAPTPNAGPQIQTAAAVIPSAPVVPADAAIAATPSAPAAAVPAKIKDAVAMVSAPVGAKLQPAAVKTTIKSKQSAVALLDRKLLSDATLGSLSRGARREDGAR
ncbi:hypothetical protein [Sphingomonas pruni]|uniref:hypothetical protein n=1 Tax=Sphingomonas pruni TaxID=40683 RepID=UPI00082E137C|nr:hypothetical protein [Sphingomonas pruni]